MELVTCPCCGTIRATGIVLDTRKHQQIFEYINAHPDCSREQIYRDLWAGLYVTSNTLSVHLSRMKPVLKRYGLAIETKRGRDGGYYKVIKIEANVPI